MRGILLLCVANSARSQMAEGIARALLPSSVGVWSAGSRPTAVRPEAVAVLREIGIDISGHRAKGIEEVPLDRIDTVITLCGGNICPVLPGATRSLHWDLSDPAAVEGSDAVRFAAFRSVRDELKRRIEELVSRELGGKSHHTSWVGIPSRVSPRFLSRRCLRAELIVSPVAR